MSKPLNLGELRASGYETVGVRDEIRRNLKAALLADGPLFPSIHGYEHSVLPEVQNALLCGHHIIFLGERGQAKSRLIREIVKFLDPWVPAVEGCDIHCDPLAPICRRCRGRVETVGDDLPIHWVSREERYGEKLATPDVSMADLIGEVDPIKVAEGRYLADEDTIHFGLVPRSHRGIFAINELPDLMEKIQVGLFNLMEERDIQIRGFKVRLPVDVIIIASANPEDYTSRGRIITPLKDRFDAQIRTHYPRDVETEIGILEQEVSESERDGCPVRVPSFMKEIIAELTFEARRAEDVNQSSGVSVRATLNNYETLIANAERRAVVRGETEIVPRISDLHAVSASMLGKLEFEYSSEEISDQDAFERLLNRAVLAVFKRSFELADLEAVVGYFEQGWGVEVSDQMATSEYLEGIDAIPGLREAIGSLGGLESPGWMASATEFVLEGLHLHQKLNREAEGGRANYRA